MKNSAKRQRVQSFWFFCNVTQRYSNIPGKNDRQSTDAW